jgi:hypothetical protein
MGREIVEKSELARCYSLSTLTMLKVLADHIKKDPNFASMTRHNASCWHIKVTGQDCEFMCDWSNFYDTRKNAVAARLI